MEFIHQNKSPNLQRAGSQPLCDVSYRPAVACHASRKKNEIRWTGPGLVGPAWSAIMRAAIMKVAFPRALRADERGMLRCLLHLMLCRVM